METKKRIIFCIENFQHGGITKALENIISLIDKTLYDVSIFVVNQENGPYKKTFSPYIKYPEDKLLKALCTNFRKYSGFHQLSLILIKSIRKIFAKHGFDIFEHRLNKWARKISKDQYDCIIAFAEGYITNFVSKIEGNKVAWIHIDYKRYLTYAHNIDESSTYNSYNCIIIPSKFSSLSFIDVFPGLKSRVRVIPNVIDSNIIKLNATKADNLDKRFYHSSCKILSVGRICYEKRFFEIPTIAKRLKTLGLDFCWYIIGDGSDVETNTLLQAITNEGMNDYVIPLGRKDNPYPYIAQCDLLVSTSLSETFSYVVFEAKTLGIPIICADFGTAPEILDDTEGIITSIEEMHRAIFELLYDDKKELKKYIRNLQNYNYNNYRIIQQFYSIIGS